MKLTAAQRRLLRAMAGGQTLKSHRDIEGHKAYRLHTNEGRSALVAWDLVEVLQDHGLIDSNKKFPSATYWLTDTGRAHLD